MRLALFVATFLLLSASAIQAQTRVPSPTPATTKFGWVHDGVNTTSWRVRVDGIEEAVTPTREGTTNNWTAPFPAMTPGDHSLEVGACLDIVNFPPLCRWSIPLAVTLVVAPTAPENIRVIPPAGN